MALLTTATGDVVVHAHNLDQQVFFIPWVDLVQISFMVAWCLQCIYLHPLQPATALKILRWCLLCLTVDFADFRQCCEDPPQGGRHVLWCCCCGRSCNQGRTETSSSPIGRLNVAHCCLFHRYVQLINLTSLWPRPQLISNLSFLPSLTSRHVQVLKKLVNVNLRIFMNCQSKLSEMPLKRWGQKQTIHASFMSTCPITWSQWFNFFFWCIGDKISLKTSSTDF